MVVMNTFRYSRYMLLPERNALHLVLHVEATPRDIGQAYLQVRGDGRTGEDGWGRGREGGGKGSREATPRDIGQVYLQVRGVGEGIRVKAGRGRGEGEGIGGGGGKDVGENNTLRKGKG
jgi:hypothetical protein